ncbi:tRNA pseudouridine(55) synthase TruB [Candidatus Uhrbacteria bacterium]|nr:tRNA pseudouridine(55) synthase TruB [Candidatus Uhrbacteria bacterium]
MIGFLLIDKPLGLTSNDVVARVRRLTGVQRVGHAGTLDPLATGLLIVGVGREATREFPRLVGLPKTYLSTFILGARSTTDDAEGEKISDPVPSLTEEIVDQGLLQLTGEITQTPPQFSAVKIKGKPAYAQARKGIEVVIKPRQVTVSTFKRIGSIRPQADGTFEIDVSIDCSSGTYIRSLARDLGRILGGGGYVKTLRRTSIGPFSAQEAIPLPAGISHTQPRGMPLGHMSDPALPAIPALPLLPVPGLLALLPPPC